MVGSRGSGENGAEGRPSLAYVHQYFRSPDMAGGSRSWELARRLADDFDVHLFTTAPHEQDAGTGNAWRHRSLGPITLHEYDMAYPHGAESNERMSAFLRFALASTQAVWRLRPDVVFASSTPLTVALPGLALRWGRRVPFVFEIRDLWPDAPVAIGAIDNRALIRGAHLLERAAYRAASTVVALSPPNGQIAAYRGAKHVDVVPNFSDPGFWGSGTHGSDEALGLPPEVAGRPIVLYPGALGAVNSPRWLVEVASECVGAEAAFVLVGTGREGRATRALAEELGVLNRNLFMLPERPKAEMPDLMRRVSLTCDLIADIPALWAASPNKVFDAFASGVPLLVNHGGWIADLVQEERAGIVAHPATPAQAADQILSFLTSPDQQRSAAAGSARLAARFDVDTGCALIGRRLLEACGR